MTFESKLIGLINSYSKENESDTPDYLLAEYISACLESFAKIVKERDKWHGFKTRREIQSEIKNDI